MEVVDSTPAFAGFHAAGRISLPILGAGYFNVIAADFNGDGKPDLLYTLVSTDWTTAQSVVLFNDGKGGYTEGPQFALDFSGCSAVDLKGDGKNAVACLGTNLSIYGNNGDGTFAAPLNYPVQLSAQDDGSWMVGDFNGDGRQDIILLSQPSFIQAASSSSTPLTAQVYLADGKGGLLAPKSSSLTLPSNRLSSGLGYEFDQVLVGDANGDGKTDVILGYEGLAPASGMVQDNFIFTLVGAGDGTFSSGVASSANTNAAEGSYIRGLALLNFTNNTHPSLAYLTDDGVQVAPGAGDGSFSLPTQSIALPSCQVTLFSANLTNSGRQDLVFVGNASAGVLRNIGSSLAAPVYYPVTNPYASYTVDWNGDGLTDILVLAAEGGVAEGDEETNPFFSVLTAQGDGTLRDATGLVPPSTFFPTQITSMVPIDVNGDGQTDFVFTSSVSETIAGTVAPNSTFGAYILSPITGGYTLVSNVLTVPSGSYTDINVIGSADFNGDGKQDLLLEVVNPNSTVNQVGIALNNGNGTFAFPSSFVQGSSGGNNVIFDVNSDGKPDVLLYGSRGLDIYIGSGSGTLVSPLSTIPLTSAQLSYPYYNYMAVGDVNGDGKPDLILSLANQSSDPSSGSTLWYPGNGNGTFGASKTISSFPGPVVLGDWNSDGTLDLAIGQWISDVQNVSIDILSNDGHGNFTQTATIPNVGVLDFDLDNAGSLNQDVALYTDDLNGDGHPDLIVGSGDGQPDITAMLGNGDGTFAPLQRYFAGNEPDRLFFVTIRGIPHSIATYDDASGQYLTLLLNQSTLSGALSASENPVVSNQVLTLTAAITPVLAGSPAPTGNVNFVEVFPVGTTIMGTGTLTNGSASAALSGLAPRSYLFAAQYVGDSNYQPLQTSTVVVTVTAPAAAPTVTVTPLPAAITLADPLTVTVSAAGASGSPTPTGTVSLVSGSYTAQLTLSAGSASFQIVAATLPVGTDTLTATYTPDAASSSTYTTASGSNHVKVTQFSPISSPVTASGGPVALGGTVTLTATVSPTPLLMPTGSVTFSTGVATLGTAPLVSGVATLNNVAATLANGLGKGVNTVQAAYSGDGNFLAASSSFGLVVYDPAIPLVLALSPASATTGGANFTLTVNGANFASNSVVLWSGQPRATTHVSSTQLTATISAADIASEAIPPVTVANLSPAAGTSAAAPFQVVSSTPVAILKGATIATAGDASGNHLLSLTGTDFVSTSAVLWNGGSRSTSYLGPVNVSATISSTDYSTRPATVTVTNPSGTSPAFTIR